MQAETHEGRPSAPEAPRSPPAPALRHQLITPPSGGLLALAVEQCVPCGRKGLYLGGWLLDPGQRLRELKLLCAEQEIDLLAFSLRKPRPALLTAFAAPFAAAGACLSSDAQPRFDGYLPVVLSSPSAPAPQLLLRMDDGSERRFPLEWTLELPSGVDAAHTLRRLLAERSHAEVDLDWLAGRISAIPESGEAAALAAPLLDAMIGLAATADWNQLSPAWFETLLRHARQRGVSALRFPVGSSAHPGLLTLEHALAWSGGSLLLSGWFAGDPLLAASLSVRLGAARTPLFSHAVRSRRAALKSSVEPWLEARSLRSDPEQKWGFIAWLPSTGLPAGDCHGFLEWDLDDGTRGRSLFLVPGSEESADEALARMGAEALRQLLPRAMHEAAPTAAWSPRLLAMTADAGQLPGVMRLEWPHAYVLLDGGLFLAGWRMDARGEFDAVYAALPDGRWVDLMAHEQRVAMPEVYKSHRSTYGLSHADFGFVCWLPDAHMGSANELPLLFVVDGRLVAHTRLALRRLPAHAGLQAETLLSALPASIPACLHMFDAGMGAAIERLWGQRRVSREAEVQDFGARPPAPEVSLIVPLYGRWDFIEYQLVQFRRDPALRACELVYVVDDPAIHEAVRAACTALHPVLEVPFRVVFGHANRGYAGANNLGASLAHGRLLLLLNSDVMPAQPGWLSRLVAAHAELPFVGALGPVLLYEDGSLQHGGMRFAQPVDWAGLWANEHPGKGLPPPALSDAPFEVEALTGACLLVDAALYRAMGGLDEGYLRGDFEDSDFCLRLRARGLRCYLVPQERLYHLERLSQNLGTEGLARRNLTLYNAWRHTQRWAAAIQALRSRAP